MTERPEFVRLFDKPNVFKATSFQAFWKSNDRKNPRLGITIKGRLSSVWRMRLKRVVREWFRACKDKLGNNDVNIVIRVPQTLDLAFVDTLKRQLRGWKA
ncbi:MAG: ribonuclease P protein component [Deltaproteobacteria bacterium]|nr:ribonuclease P protein component [Deltaproteobacteria bacterium]